MEYTTRVSDCLQVSFPFDAKKTYRIEVLYTKKTRLQKYIERAKKVLIEGEGGSQLRERTWQWIASARTVEEFLAIVENSPVDYALKLRLKETIM